MLEGCSKILLPKQIAPTELVLYTLSIYLIYVQFMLSKTFASNYFRAAHAINEVLGSLLNKLQEATHRIRCCLAKCLLRRCPRADDRVILLDGSQFDE